MPDENLLPKFRRMFRVIPAADFLAHFASDRRHMKSGEGKWLQPPPAYLCIRTEEAVHNLEDFISMDKTCGVGQIMDLKELFDHFGAKSLSQ